MVRAKPFLWGVILVGTWLLASSDIPLERYGDWAPYFMTRPELENSVSLAGKSRDMVNPGKIWIAGNRIYVVERYKGVHIIDNTDPAAPRQINFIVAPGCMDVAVKDKIVYLDNSVDLVAFDMATGSVTKRLKNYFPEPVSPSGSHYRNDSSDMILVGWKPIEKEEGRP
jgi:hypothetical protein